MWSAIANDISKAINQDFVISQTESLTGGDINSAFCITNGHVKFFVKINQKQYLESFIAESISLSHIAKCNQLIFPKVITYGCTINNSYLVLEFLEMHTNSTKVPDPHWFTFGQRLANLHNTNQQAEFGWPDDNYIGLTIQPNAWQHNWSVFFAEQRIGYQLQLLKDKGIEFGDIETITQQCQQTLAHHRPTPSLVHGDLWRGNVAFVNGKPCVYDPACYYADAEVDIAMSELFGGFPDSFYQGYHTVNPQKKGYNRRKLIYNGYHILNHANLFAGTYIDQAWSFINDLAKID